MTSTHALKKRLKGAEFLTPKQRMFAEYYVSNYPNVTKKEAAKQAGYSEKICEKTGSILTNPDKYPYVVAYIEKLRDSASKQYRDHLRHLKRLDNLAILAEEKGQLAAAINAEFRLGQSVGLYVDRKEIKVQDLSSMSKEELIKTINELKDEIPNSKILEVEAEDQKKINNTEKEFWDLFHKVHNGHLNTRVGEVVINVKKKD
jgi:ribosomal protein L29